MKTYALQACEKLVAAYLDRFGGEVATVSEGVLGLGTTILHRGNGVKSVEIQERPS